MADVCQTCVIEKNLLHDEDGNSFAKLGAGLHDAQTKRDDLGGEQKVDNFRRIILDEGADDTERSESQVLKRSTLRSRVQEWIEKERNVCCNWSVGAWILRIGQHTTQEEAASFGMRCNTLKQCKSIADAIGGGGGQLRRVQQWVDGNDLLE